MDFPHLQGATSWPGSGREVFSQVPADGYDAERWRDVGAKVTLTSVPWGTYDPATCDDVPGFDTEAARESWFSAHLASTPSESVTLDTRVRYQMDEYVDVPLTFDQAARHNYCIIEYPEAPVEYGTGGLRKWYFHIVGCNYLSPNATRLMLAHDWWVTLAPLAAIDYMMLERGHAPMSAGPTVAQYLASPQARSSMLLAPDVDYGTGAARVAAAHDVILNSGTMRAVLCLRGLSAQSAPASAYTAASFSAGIVQGQGVPADMTLACATADLATLLSYLNASWPQALECVDALFIAPVALLTTGTSATLGGVSVWWGCYGTSRDVGVTLSQSDFGYPAEVADFAKLYTWPYAHVEMADDQGRVTEIRIEDMQTGTLTVHESLNAAYPFLTYLAHVDGIGGPRRTLSFAALSAQSFPAGGKWYDTLRSWGVPMWSVWQSNAAAYDYQTHYSRAQAANDADTAQTNAGNTANNITANNAVAVAANNSLLSYKQQAALRGATLSNTKLADDAASDLTMSSHSYEAELAGIAVAMSNNDAQAFSGAVSTVANALNITSPDFGFSALGAAVSQYTSWSTSNASLGVSQSNSEALYTAAYQQASAKTAHSTAYNTQATTLQNSNAADNVTVQNNSMTSTSSNNASLMNTNASNIHANAYEAIQNQIREAAMQAPQTFGTSANGAQAAVRPIGLSFNVVTESPGSIAQAGAQFARYGYAYGQQWRWTSWNLRKHFTYWQCADVWARTNGRIPEQGAAYLRQMLHNGVTAWKDPDEIGQVSIYE